MRARAVCYQLIKIGMTTTATHKGRGSHKPLASNKTARGRALNRRVELTITR